MVASSSTGKSTVHGIVIGELSPVKTSKKRSDVKYFDGAFSDGRKTLCKQCQYKPCLSFFRGLPFSSCPITFSSLSKLFFPGVNIGGHIDHMFCTVAMEFTTFVM